jgi:outer membrane immunogenic protein
MPVPGPAPAYTPPAYRPALYDWTGIYIGGNVGGGWMNDTVTATTTTVLQPAGTQTKLAPMGVLGGAQAGVNIEFSPVVLGVEGTWLATNLSGSRITPSPPPGSGISEASTSAAPWIVTAAARIGIAANDLLFYAKGGAAWMRVDYTEQPFSAGGFNTTQTFSDTRTGWTVGGGFEFGMTENLSIKVEYDYLGFGTKTYTFTNLSYSTTSPAVPIAVGPQPVAIKSALQMATVGINYRFNWGGGGPVPAKY